MSEGPQRRDIPDSFPRQPLHLLRRRRDLPSLSQVLDWNTKAISFYDRLGAQIKTSWRCVRLEGDALRDFEVSEEVQALGLPPHQ